VTSLIFIRIVHNVDSYHFLVIIKNDRVITETYFRGYRYPIALKSVTKSIVSIAIGLLLHERTIPSLDTPISTWYPEWKEGLKAKLNITFQ